MKLFRFTQNGQVHWGAERKGKAYRIESLEDQREREAVEFPELQLLPPATPGKIVAVGRNYLDHARELGNDAPEEPILFLKPPSALVSHEGLIELPASSRQVDHEGELALIIGKKARHVKVEEWRDVVLGFTCANDVTARDLQRKDIQFTRAKSFDTFCPLGPWIETELDPADLELTTRVNGGVRQRGRTSRMLFGPPELLVFISSVMTLDPGDVILTGTPAGVAPLRAGDTVEVEIEGIGVLRNHVIDEFSN